MDRARSFAALRMTRYHDDLMKKTVFLIDALPYVFRAYFALPEIRSPRGANINAVYGFARFLIKLLAEEKPSHVMVAFDESLTTSFRNDFYPDYKANRVLPPPELEAQLKYCQRMAQALGCRVLADHRYEADDLIATARHKLSKENCAFVIVSGDKDLLQLVDARTRYYNVAKHKWLNEKAVEVEMGLRPDQIPDFLGLAGDSADNIPGVSGVGNKTAVALLKEFQTMENLYANLDRVGHMKLRGAGTLAGKLREGKRMAQLSTRLATFSVEAPMRESLKTLAYKGYDKGLAMPLMEELGFIKMIEISRKCGDTIPI